MATLIARSSLMGILCASLVALGLQAAMPTATAGSQSSGQMLTDFVVVEPGVLLSLCMST